MMEESEHDHDEGSETTESQPLRSSAGISDSGKMSPHVIEGIVKKGILSKRGRKKIFHPWVLRTIVLDNRNVLTYLDGKTLKGTVNLEGTTVSLVPPEKANGRQFAFEISSISNTRALQTTTLMLAASSLKEAEDWVEAIVSLTAKHVSSKGNVHYESLEVSIYQKYNFI